MITKKLSLVREWHKNKRLGLFFPQEMEAKKMDWIVNKEKYNEAEEIEYETIQPSEEWKPQTSGQMLDGDFVRKEEAVGTNSNALYHFDCKGEKGSVKRVKVWGSVILDDRLWNVEVGDPIRIIYYGKEKSKVSGREYIVYEVKKGKKERKKERTGFPAEPML